MATCTIRVPDTASPTAVRAAIDAAKAALDARRTGQPVATIAHHRPGEARLTCTCNTLNIAVDVDDPEIREWLLAEHLRLRHPGSDHLLIDDARTGVLSSLTPDASAEASLVLGGTR